MNILVTGGAGYIGSVTADHLLRSGHQVTIYDNLGHGHFQSLPPTAKFIQGDIGDRAAVSRVLNQGFDAVMHFAALIEAGESMLQPDLYVDNNVHKSRLFFDTVTQARVPFVVFSSTAAVYQSSDRPLTETDPINPASVYGQTKKQTEDYLLNMNESHDLGVVTLRYFNAAGASLLTQPPVRGEAHQPETHLIPNIIKRVIAQENLFVLNGGDYPTPDGTCIRDYIHVDDLASAHLLALDWLVSHPGKFEVFNLGNGNGYSNRHVANVVKQVTGSQIDISTGPRRPGDAAILIADSRKAKQILGWQPQHADLHTIVQSAWSWHHSHPNGYESSDK